MLQLSESYKNRLKTLAGIIQEVVAMSSQEINNAFEDSTARFPFNQGAMSEAIQKGQVIGLSYQSEGMPVTKFRLIMPVAMGVDKLGGIKIRGYHLKGQSEKAAGQTGSRSAEVAGEWRLFKASNVKSMWMVDKYFYENPPKYNPNDSAMVSMLATYNVNTAKSLAPQVEPEPVVEPVAEPTPTAMSPTSSRKVLQKQRPQPVRVEPRGSEPDITY